MFTPYQIAFAHARKPYQIWLLLTHRNGDFRVISVTQAVPRPFQSGYSLIIYILRNTHQKAMS